MLESNPSRNSQSGNSSKTMSGVVDLWIGGPLVLDRFLHASKTHQVKSPRSGIHSSPFLKVRKKFRLNSRGCIFSRSPIVQVVASRPVFSVATDAGAVRLR